MRQTDDTRIHQSFGSVDHHEKERSDEPVYEPLSEPQTGAHAEPRLTHYQRPRDPAC